jgi:hypothetical protein
MTFSSDLRNKYAHVFKMIGRNESVSKDSLVEWILARIEKHRGDLRAIPKNEDTTYEAVAIASAIAELRLVLKELDVDKI